MAEARAEPGGLGAGAGAGGGAIEASIWNALPHYLPLAIFPLIVAAALFGGWWIAGPCIFFVLANPLDIAFGANEKNLDPAKTPEARLIWYDRPVWLWALLWPVTFAFTLWHIFIVGHLSIWEGVLMALVLAVEAQAIFIVGHELVHRRAAWERRLGEFLLASASYPQYATEHIYVHHALVGTPLDVGSAPRGESLWHYFPREVASNFVCSWRVTRERLARRRRPMWHRSNPFWRYGIETAFWYALVYWMGGWWAVLIYVFLCFYVVFSMKLSNYIQHYGLRRIRLPNGRFEKVRPRHSWSADGKFSNWLFYNMQRHADHHALASRHYPLLQFRGADESPQMPGSYGKMFGLAMRPRRWFETMDPLVDQWRKHFYPEIDDWSAYDSPVSEARPEAFDAIVEIFAAAPRLARSIERNPELLDTLRQPEFTDLDLRGGFGPNREFEATARRGLARLYWTHEFGVPEMKERIAESPVQDAGDAVETVRNWSNDKTFQIGMHTLRGNLTPIEAGAALDVLFVHDGGSAHRCEALCQRFRRALRSLSQGSLLFAPLPRDREGPALRSLSDLAECDRAAVSTGEFLKLTRARCVFGSGAAGIGRRFADARRAALARGAARDALIAELRQASGSTAAPGFASIVDMKGGLGDVERRARLLQLTHVGWLRRSGTGGRCTPSGRQGPGRAPRRRRRGARRRRPDMANPARHRAAGRR